MHGDTLVVREWFKTGGEPHHVAVRDRIVQNDMGVVWFQDLGFGLDRSSLQRMLDWLDKDLPKELRGRA